MTADFYVPSNGIAHSLADVVAFDYLKRRAAVIVTDGELHMFPVIEAHIVPSPATPAVH